VVCDRFLAGEADDAALMVAAGRRRVAEGWDLVVGLTDLPRRTGLRPVVAEASLTDGVALASLPALGARRLYHRARSMVVRLVGELTRERLGSGRPDGARPQGDGRRTARLGTPIRRVVPTDDGIDVRFVLPGLRGQARLLTGMVKANRPWRLIVGLSGALAAALAAGAFAVVTSDIWVLAHSLGPLRLSIVTAFSIGAMVAWLIIDHELWERPTGRVPMNHRRLFNAATVLTVVLGVVTLYVALFGVTLGTAWLLVKGEVLRDNLEGPVGWRDYATIAWMATSVATVGGALGSGLESDAAVREAAYGYRQQERADERDR
jgi:hypothetical protein